MWKCVAGSRAALAAKLVAGANPPLPLPSSTDTSLELKFPVARSGLPSPLKSATATDAGPKPTPKFRPRREARCPPRRWHKGQAGDAYCGGRQKRGLGKAAFHDCFSNRAGRPEARFATGLEAVASDSGANGRSEARHARNRPSDRSVAWLRDNEGWVSLGAPFLDLSSPRAPAFRLLSW